jgi:hypothetical protein
MEKKMTASEYVRSIEESTAMIKAIDCDKGWSYEKILEAMMNIRKLPIILFTYPKGNLLFRSRINNGLSLYTSKTEISAPREKFVNDYSRANKPRQTLFYCSEDRLTSYAELLDHMSEISELGKEVQITIGGWRLLEDVQLVLVFNPLAPRTSRYYQFHGEAFDKVIENTPPEFKKGTIKFFEFIGAEYSKQVPDETTNYLKTCAYSNIVFGHEQCDGILYPSVPGRGEGFNIALKKEVITKNALKLEMVRTDKFLTKIQNNGKYHYVNISSINSSELKYDTIEWNSKWE